eukprot:886888-Amphidinium_carterae.1
MQDLERFAELEHNTAKNILAEGRQFYVYVEQQARGFSQAESNAACSNADRLGTTTLQTSRCGQTTTTACQFGVSDETGQ